MRGGAEGPPGRGPPGGGPPGGGPPGGGPPDGDPDREPSSSRQSTVGDGNPGNEQGSTRMQSRPGESQERSLHPGDEDIRFASGVVSMYGNSAEVNQQYHPMMQHGVVLKDYLRRTWERYNALISRALGEVVTTSEGNTRYPVVKVASVDGWNGESNYAKFELFLTLFLQRARLNHLGGEQLEKECLSHLGTHMKEHASQWWTNHIDGPSARILDWSMI